MEYRKLTDLQKLENNPRTITKDDFEKLKLSIKNNKDYFEARPLILSNRTGKLVIIGGNQRYEAAKALGMDKVPTYLLKNISEQREREIIIRDNISNGQFDWDILGNEWSDEPLEEWGVDTPGGWSQGEAEEDDAPEVSSQPAVSKLGEVYQLGRHRLMCGDSTKDTFVSDKFFDKATIGFTSPPYNVGHNLGYKGKDSKYENSTDDSEEYYEFLQAFNTIALRKTQYSFVNLQLLANNKRQILQFLYSNIESFCDVAFWKKSQVAPAMAEKVMNSQVECVFIFGGNASRAITTANFRGNVSNFIETPSASAENENADIHNATFPIAFVSHFINNFTNKGDSVYDAFGGSGSTLIACEQLGRTCYMAEIDPKYADVIRKRYAKFTNNNELPDNWEQLTPVIK